MSTVPQHFVSRRHALAGLAATCAAGVGLIGPASADAAGPTFSASGPDAQTYGAAQGYPVPDAATARRQGNPWEKRDRVGAFTHIDAIYPTRLVKRAVAPWTYKRAPADMSDAFRRRVTDYLERNPVTGLLVARDDHIVFEHYQYGRTDRDRFVSQSMVKSIMAMLIGIAICRRRDQIGRRYRGDLCAGLQRHRVWQDADPRSPAYVLGCRIR